MRTLFLGLLLTGCVVRQYGTGVAVSGQGESLAPVNFSEIEAELEAIIGAETENIDKRDRLEAAWELLQKMKTQRPAAQHAAFGYLSRLVEIEKRSNDGVTDAVADPNEQRFTPISAIQSSSIGGDEPIVKPRSRSHAAIVPPDAGTTAVLKAAREHMGAGDLEAALRQLDVCQGQPCGAATITLWKECRDRLVYGQRERAGQLFLEAGNSADATQRKTKLEEALEILHTVRDRFPDSRYKEGVLSSIATVEQAMADQ